MFFCCFRRKRWFKINSVPQNICIGVIGLGYIGLPLAIAWSDHYPVVGYDTDPSRIKELAEGHDRNGEHTVFPGRKNLLFSSRPEVLVPCTVFVIAVPTPVDDHHVPDRSALAEASGLAGRHLKSGDTVIYESTVYPGCTEEFCIPILEQVSGLSCGKDFFCGYSPERMNPGDPGHRLENVVKLVSGTDDRTASFVEDLYRKIVPAGTFRTRDIRTAEASKVMENIQRDVNIAFMNETTVLFHSLGLRMEDVLAAARTRWNFVSFTPGLVGGHCVSVDPYWLSWKAAQGNVDTPLLLSARSRNETMAKYLSEQIVREMIRRGIGTGKSQILIFGFTFKANCRDCRNTKIASLARELRSWGCGVSCVDPLADKDFALREYGENILCLEDLAEMKGQYDAIVGAVAHDVFSSVSPQDFLRLHGFVYDMQNVFPGVPDRIRL